MNINVNAERCRAYRQRISNVSDRLQNTDTTLSQQGNDISVPQKENIMLMNEDKMIQNDINNYFYQMHDLNDDEIEVNSFIYKNNSDDYSDNETNSDSELDYSTDTNDFDNTLLYPNGSISLHQAYAAIKNFIVKCNLTYTHILYLITLILFLLPFGHRLTKLGILNWYNKCEQFTYKTLCIKCCHQ
ncbi:unnamed protein product, partial [Rotaria sp. Silwood2]